jgi:hypothetical protein
MRFLLINTNNVNEQIGNLGMIEFEVATSLLKIKCITTKLFVPSDTEFGELHQAI